MSGPFAVLGRTASGGGAGSGLSRAGSGSPGASPDAPSSCASTARPSAQLELVRWAARHPHLQRLALQLDAAALAADPGLATAVAEAKKLRPALHIALA